MPVTPGVFPAAVAARAAFRAEPVAWGVIGG